MATAQSRKAYSSIEPGRATQGPGGEITGRTSAAAAEHQLTRSDYKRLMKAVTGAEMTDSPRPWALQATSPVTGDVRFMHLISMAFSPVIFAFLPAEGSRRMPAGAWTACKFSIPDAKPAFLKFASLEKWNMGQRSRQDAPDAQSPGSALLVG